MVDKAKKILVTGSSGVIGNGLCEFLDQNDIGYVGVDIRDNIWNENVRTNTIKMDLRDTVDDNMISDKIDMIIHLAANARVYDLVVDPIMARDNFITLFNICELARRKNIKKIIFSSSREVYGNSNRVIYNENEFYVKHCKSPYAASKIAGEALLHSYKQCYGIENIILRFSNVFGKYDYSDRVIPQFILRLIKNEKITIYGKDKLFDFTYIDDTVSGIIKSVDNFEKAKDEVYNIATGIGYSLDEIAQYIFQLTNSSSKKIFKGNRTGEVVRFIADITKAKTILGYNPQYDIINGLKKAVGWYKPRIKEFNIYSLS